MANKFKIRHVLDGTIITQDKILRQGPYLILFACLSILLIANNYTSERIIRETNSISRELNELRTVHLATLSRYLEVKRQTEILNRLNEAGTGRWVIQPPKRIIVER